MRELDRIHDEHVKNSDPCPECGSLIRRDWEWAYLYQHATTCSKRGVRPDAALAREFGEPTNQGPYRGTATPEEIFAIDNQDDIG